MEHWSKYWQYSGVLNSFAEGEASSGYTGALKQHWEAIFAALPNAAAVVDIGTGNGALALLAHDYSKANQKDFNLHGIDAAKIDPAAALKQTPAVAKKLKAIQFHSEIFIEKAPFKDATVDAYVSQFGFEYADRKQALKVILASLKEKGSAHFMVHNAQSGLVKNSTAGIEVIESVLTDSPLFQLADLYIDLARQAIPQLGEKGWQEFSHQKVLTQSIQWIMRELQDKFSKQEQQVWVNDIVRRVARTLERVAGSTLEDCVKQLAYEYHSVNDHKQRLVDQNNAAFAKKDITALQKLVEKAGASFTAEEFSMHDDSFGWAITIQK